MDSLDGPVYGLVTDPGPFVSAPPGSLATADNVCVRRPGVVEPRGSFLYTFNATESTATPLAVWEWEGANYVVYDDNSLWKNASGLGGFFVTFTGGQTWSEITRDRLLFTCDNGVQELQTSSSFSRRAGTWRGHGFFSQCTASGVASFNWLATDSCVAYRTVAVRYVGSSPVFGAPSDRHIVRNHSGATTYVQLRCYLGDGLGELIAGDQIQLYRTVTSTPYTATPSDELRLRVTLTVTNADITAGYIDFSDYGADAQLFGASLYTNATQQGILQANYRPYLAKDICYYNSMAFYAAHTSPHRVSVTATCIGQDVTGSTPADKSQVLGVSGVTPVTFALGATTITAPADYRTGGVAQGAIAVGQIITAFGGQPEVADAVFAANTSVTAFNPTTGVITLSAATLSGLAAGTVQVWDWISVGSGFGRKIIYASSGFADITKTKLWGTADGSAGGNEGRAGGAPDMERCWIASYATSGFRLYANETGLGPYNGVQLVFERELIGVSGFEDFTLYSTKPNAFDRYCDTITGIASAPDGGNSFLAFSKVREPEAVPLINFQTIGSTSNTIRRLARLQDSLMVFTDEGLYRVNGTSPQDITIESFDTTCVLLTPQFLAQAFGVLWCWTTRGIMRIDFGGVTQIDQAIYRGIDQAMDMSSHVLTSPWSLGSNTMGLVAFGYVGTSSGTDSTTATKQWFSWIYHPKTNAWTRWYSRRPVSAATFRVTNRPLVGVKGGYASYFYTEATIATNTLPTIGDLILPVNVTAVGGDGVTLTLASGNFSPSIGDALAPGGVLYFITSVSSPTSVTVDRAGVVTGNQPAIEAFPMSVEWVAFGEGDPSQDKDWSDLRVMFDRWKYGKEITFSYYGYTDNASQSETIPIDISDTSGTIERSYTYYQTRLIPNSFRRLIPNTVNREWGLRVGFQTVYPTFFSTAGVGRAVRAAGNRVARR